MTPLPSRVPPGMLRYKCVGCGLISVGTADAGQNCPGCSTGHVLLMDAGRKPPLTPMKHSNERQWVRLGARTAAKVMRMLWDAPCSVKDIRDETGLAETSIRDYIAALHALKLVHICGRGYAVNGIRRVPLYRFDPGKPDVLLKPKSGAERSADYRERHRLKPLSMLGTLQEQFAPIEQRKTRDRTRKEPV